LLRFRSIVWMLGAQFQYGLSGFSVKVVRHNFGEYFWGGLWKRASTADELVLLCVEATRQEVESAASATKPHEELWRVKRSWLRPQCGEGNGPGQGANLFKKHCAPGGCTCEICVELSLCHTCKISAFAPQVRWLSAHDATNYRDCAHGGTGGLAVNPNAGSGLYAKASAPQLNPLHSR